MNATATMVRMIKTMIIGKIVLLKRLGFCGVPWVGAVVGLYGEVSFVIVC